MSDDPLNEFRKKNAAWREPTRDNLRERREALREARMKERARAAYISVGGDPVIFERTWPEIRARILAAGLEAAPDPPRGGANSSATRDMLRRVAASAGETALPETDR